MSINTELKDIYKKYGRMEPDLVIRTARANSKCELHKRFNWDLKKAAYAHWLDQARDIIRSFKITIKVVEHKPVIVSYFVHDPDRPNEQGYRPILEIRKEPDSARKLMVEKFRHAKEHLARAEDIALVVGKT